MIGPLKTLFALQLRRADEDAEFVSRLDSGRTVLLSGLIADVRNPASVARLNARWLDAGRFTARIASACSWLDAVAMAEPAKGWNGIPLFLFQPATEDEDAEAHRQLLERDGDVPPALQAYTARFAHLPPAIQYLPTHARTAAMLDGAYAQGRMRLRPLFSTFSTCGQPYVLDGDREYHPVRGRIIGYRVPDFAALLDVSSAVATDLLARVVTHDLCHTYLPDTPFEAEGFHNVAALAAMGTLPSVRYRHRWEEFLHAECTDPAFGLGAGEAIRDMRKALGMPSPIQDDVLKEFARWYASPAAARKRREIWGLPDGAGPADLRAAIEEARADGFRLYVRLMRNRA